MESKILSNSVKAATSYALLLDMVRMLPQPVRQPAHLLRKVAIFMFGGPGAALERLKK